jgi:GTPase
MNDQQHTGDVDGHGELGDAEYTEFMELAADEGFDAEDVDIELAAASAGALPVLAVVGRPNVGKSTLVNALVGARVSIVSNRPQTTRHRLLGIATFPAGQLVLVDTPGLHGEQKKAMNRMMNRAARGALEGVDAAVLVVEAGRWEDDDALAYIALREAGVPVVLAVNQVDRFKDKAALLPYLQQVTDGREFASVHPVSALKRVGLEALVSSLLALVPEQPPLYGEDEITDRSQRFLAGELVREQLMRQLGAELPYATTVEIESFAEDLDAVLETQRAGEEAFPGHRRRVVLANLIGVPPRGDLGHEALSNDLGWRDRR